MSRSSRYGGPAGITKSGTWSFVRGGNGYSGNSACVLRKKGRPKGAKGILPAMAVIALRLPTWLSDLIDEWGAERGMTRSESLRTGSKTASTNDGSQ